MKSRSLFLAAALLGTAAQAQTSKAPAAPAQTSKAQTSNTLAAQTAAQAKQAAGLPISIQQDNRFLILSEQGIVGAFPNPAARPDVVLVTRDKQVTVALEYRNTALRPNELTSLLTQYPPVLRQQLPALQSLNADIIRAGGTQWAQFVMTMPAAKGGTRRLEQLITSVNNRPLVVTIDSSAGGYQANETAVRNLVNSIQVLR